MRTLASAPSRAGSSASAARTPPDVARSGHGSLSLVSHQEDQQRRDEEQRGAEVEQAVAVHPGVSAEHAPHHLASCEANQCSNREPNAPERRSLPLRDGARDVLLPGVDADPAEQAGADRRERNEREREARLRPEQQAEAREQIGQALPGPEPHDEGAEQRQRFDVPRDEEPRQDEAHHQERRSERDEKARRSERLKHARQQRVRVDEREAAHEERPLDAVRPVVSPEVSR